MNHLLSNLIALAFVLVASNLMGQEIASDPIAAKAEPVIQVTGNNRIVASGSRSTADSNNTHFGTHALFGALVTRTFTIQNTGDDILQMRNLETVQLKNTDSLTFKVTKQPGKNRLGAGGSTAFNIRYDPDTAKRQTAIVEIRSNDSSRTPYTFLISGRGEKANTANPANPEAPQSMEVYQGRDDQIHVRLQATAAPNRTVSLSNLQGEVLRSLDVGSSKQHLTLGTANLPKGVYIITSHSPHQHLSRKLMLR
jgi:hypothetical protein